MIPVAYVQPHLALFFNTSNHENPYNFLIYVHFLPAIHFPINAYILIF